MKSSRAQRLFMKAGIVDNRLRAYTASFRKVFAKAARKNPCVYAGITKEIRVLRRERKKALRAALEAWRHEQDSAILRALNENLID